MLIARLRTVTCCDTSLEPMNMRSCALMEANDGLSTFPEGEFSTFRIRVLAEIWSRPGQSNPQKGSISFPVADYSLAMPTGCLSTRFSCCHERSRKVAIMASCFILAAHASGVAQGSASGSWTGAPRSISNSTSFRRPQRHAHPNGVDLSRSSRKSHLAPWSSNIDANRARSSSLTGPW
jgi:hypothetical protein